MTLIRPLVHLCFTYCAITVTYVNGVVALIDTHDDDLTIFRVSGLSDSHSSNKPYVWLCVGCLLSGMYVLGTESHINVWYITSLTLVYFS